MSAIETIAAITVTIGLCAAFGLGWVAGTAHVAKLRRQLANTRAEVVELADQLAESEEALARSTGGMNDILDAVRRRGQDGGSS